MSGSSPPPDNSAQVAQIQAQSQKDAQAAADAKAAADRQRFNDSVSSAYGGAINDADQYFTSRGLDASQYSPYITAAANSAKNSIPDLSGSPGTAFTDLGATAYNQAQDAQRGNLQRQINQFAPSGFETRAIGDTSDDATLASVLASQRASADQYVKNLLDRGVINSSGYTAAEGDLDNQSYGAKARLQDIGNQEIQKGRSNVLNIANSARSGAANYALGDNFDPYQYSTDISSALQDFFTNMGGDIKGLVPNNLFSTSGLGNLAGAAMGAQNLKFNPAALAGVASNDDNPDDQQQQFLSAF